MVVKKEMSVECNSIYATKQETYNNVVMVTPQIDSEYWKYRVHLHEDQYVIAFDKFSTYGIGFAIEDDWNTNLPYNGDPKKIANHIWHNRKYDQITMPMLISAIKLLRMTCFNERLNLTRLFLSKMTEKELMFNNSNAIYKIEKEDADIYTIHRHATDNSPFLGKENITDCVIRISGKNVYYSRGSTYSEDSAVKIGVNFKENIGVIISWCFGDIYRYSLSTSQIVL